MISTKIPADPGEVVAPAIKTIQKICTTDAKIDIDDDGSVFYFRSGFAAAYAARRWWMIFALSPEVGKLYYGRWSASCPLAFVEIAAMTALVHISKLENYRVDKVEDVLKLGDMTGSRSGALTIRARGQLQPHDAFEGAGTEQMARSTF